MTEKLLPCPFCGVSDHLSAIKTGSAAGHYYPYAVICRHLDCDDVRGPTGNGEAEAIAAWNSRTPAPEGEVALYQIKNRLG
jgi:Lar family restriction alleviation protein